MVKSLRMMNRSIVVWWLFGAHRWLKWIRLPGSDGRCAGSPRGSLANGGICLGLPSGNIAIENGHRYSGFFPLKKLIFHSYVKLPEGKR